MTEIGGAPEPLSLVVAMLTFRRPEQLSVGLPLVVSQVQDLVDAHGGALRARVLVVDNDPDGSARQTVERWAAGVTTYVVEPTPGIAAARNRALDEASADDVLVFIDDDERPRPGWLAALVTTWQRYGSSAVMGRVISVLEPDVDPWVRAGGFFIRKNWATGERIPTAATNNLLLDLRVVRRLGLRFALSLGLSGSEDTMFTRELVRRGGDIVWCAEAVLDDPVPASRATRRWVLARSFSHGNGWCVVELGLARPGSERAAVRARFALRGAGRIVLGYPRYLAGLIARDDRQQARGLRMVYRGAGMMSALFGGVYQEYSHDRARRA
jgi:glycosyltransferase involved in cell wall biosynthesis